MHTFLLVGIVSIQALTFKLQHSWITSWYLSNKQHERFLQLFKPVGLRMLIKPRILKRHCSPKLHQMGTGRPPPQSHPVCAISEMSKSRNILLPKQQCEHRECLSLMWQQVNDEKMWSTAFEKIVLMVSLDQCSGKKLGSVGGEKGSYLEMRWNTEVRIQNCDANNEILDQGSREQDWLNQTMKKMFRNVSFKTSQKYSLSRHMTGYVARMKLKFFFLSLPPGFSQVKVWKGIWCFPKEKKLLFLSYAKVRRETDRQALLCLREPWELCMAWRQVSLPDL